MDYEYKLSHPIVLKPEYKKTISVYDRKQELEQAFHNLYIIQPFDEDRVFDCLYYFHYITTPQPFYPFEWMFYFNSNDSMNIKNGFMLMNEWPVFVSIYNYERYNLDSKIFIGIRGLDWGVHKSTLSLEMRNMIDDKNFQDDILFLPDNYVFISNKHDLRSDPVQSICHSRSYEHQGFIGNTWPAFDDNGGWKIIDKFFPFEHLYIFGYSNGAAPRNQLIETKKLFEEKYSDDPYVFIHQYSFSHEFKNPEAQRIYGIVDIETNYESINDLGKLLQDFYIKDPQRIFYATCNLHADPIANHVKLIQMFHLIGIENEEGVVRYSNSNMTIVIDIITNEHYPYYQTYEADLESDTIFIKNTNIKNRIVLSHNSIIHYTVENFKSLLKNRNQNWPEFLN